MKFRKISENINGNVKAPKSPMDAVLGILEHFSIKTYSLSIYRLFMDDDKMLNEKDGTHSITEYDHLLLVANGNTKIFFIDEGVRSCPLFYWHKEEFLESGFFEEKPFLNRPDKKALLKLIEDIPFDIE